MAELIFTHGTMGSQKTASLLLTAYGYVEHGGNVLVTKPSIDTKGDRHVVSRAGMSREVDFLTTLDMDVEQEVLRRQALLRREKERARVNAVLVDEAQFLPPYQVDQLLALAVMHGISVQAFGLRTDFRTQMFPGSRRLLEVAHEIRESPSVCANGDGCESKAVFNARLAGGVYASEGDVVAIDGEADVTYRALCAVHYMRNVGPISSGPPAAELGGVDGPA